MLRMVRDWIARVWKAVRADDRLGRVDVARAYLRGRGLEIGALHRPLRLPAAASVTYVDRLSESELRLQYPELALHALVPVGVIDEAEALSSVPDGSQDFVVANHFLEHCQDPIGTLKTFVRVLRPGGVAYLTVPDKRFTFDRDRPVTPLAHLLRDHEDGPEWSRREHFEEYVRLALGVTDPDESEQKVEELLSKDYSIHFHVWTQREFAELLAATAEEVGFEIELFLKRKYEVIAVLRKEGLAADDADDADQAKAVVKTVRPIGSVHSRRFSD
jgi:predicted SAM-dependent methyltransferase